MVRVTVLFYVSVASTINCKSRKHPELDRRIKSENSRILTCSQGLESRRKGENNVCNHLLLNQRKLIVVK